jgi:hypothetical protein
VVRQSRFRPPPEHEGAIPRSTGHRCPGAGCMVDVPRSQLACRPHWFSLPADLRGRVWAAWRSGNTEAHSQAIADCLSFFRAETDALLHRPTV